jgi:hypothetical protein
MTMKAKAVLEVREVSVVQDRLVVVVALIEGEFRPDMTVDNGQGGHWRVTGVGFAPANAWSAGLRALTLEPLSGEGNIEAGARLTASSSAEIPQNAQP